MSACYCHVEEHAAELATQENDFLVEQEEEEPFGETQRVGDAQHAKVVPHGRVVERSGQLEVGERQHVEYYAQYEHYRAEQVVHIEVDNI